MFREQCIQFRGKPVNYGVKALLKMKQTGKQQIILEKGLKWVSYSRKLLKNRSNFYQREIAVCKPVLSDLLHDPFSAPSQNF